MAPWTFLHGNIEKFLLTLVDNSILPPDMTVLRVYNFVPFPWIQCEEQSHWILYRYLFVARTLWNGSNCLETSLHTSYIRSWTLPIDYVSLHFLCFQSLRNEWKDVQSHSDSHVTRLGSSLKFLFDLQFECKSLFHTLIFLKKRWTFSRISPCLLFGL